MNRQQPAYNQPILQLQHLFAMQLQASIFKAYDLRGVVGTGLTEAVAEHLGRAFGTEAKAGGE